ncbi:CD63 antigen [Hyla sarda]|uniref:CD63 antigen n=1 Tax=Hyla sarda TaxID=327740 RepID=UPI0024C45BE7|nr:CD63 antigen [Hyla sarda]
MAVEGGMKCVKYLVFLFNFLFWICGCALIGLGIFVLVEMNNPQLFKNVSSGAPVVIIAVGVIIFFISFFGCCGAARENYCMVTTFAVLLVLIFLVEIAAAIAGYVYRNQLQNIFTDSFMDGMRNYQNSTDVQKAIDDLQRNSQCCGANNYTDWYKFEPFKTPPHVPTSCCIVNATGCDTDPSKIYSVGCVPTIEALMRKSIGIIAGVALGIAFFEVLGIIFACCLMKGIRSGYEVM